MINRLIIIGNGFDIAHGLKTKYSDFVQNYYSSLKNSGDWDDEFFKCSSNQFVLSGHKNINSIIEYLEMSLFEKHRFEGNKIRVNRNCIIDVKNSLFYRLSKKHSIQNWVDIENEYFNNLLQIIDKERAIKKENKADAIFNEIRTLNDEMDAIAKIFEKYLSENVVPLLDMRIAPIRPLLDENILVSSAEYKAFLEEFPKRYTSTSDRFNHKNPVVKKYSETMILNFNYTHTFEILYKEHMSNTEFINIHGSLNDVNNPINLGFGDEMSKRYGEIEDFNENEYLRLMKSFAYSNNSNYKKLFDFIESDDFQVQIMGHSCGTSDRTLLNAIFENHNCKSIKVFFHEYLGEDGLKHNNYSDIVRNISRHFNQKTMMRERIVNKNNTERLI